MIKAMDIWPSIVLLSLGIFIVFEARNWPTMDASGTGPGLFPMIQGIGLILLSAALGIRSLRLILAGHSPIGNWRSTRRAIVAAAALALCVAMMPFLGFYVSFSLLTLFVVSGMYGRPLLTGVACAIGCSGVFYLIFTLALGVRLPANLYGF